MFARGAGALASSSRRPLVTKIGGYYHRSEQKHTKEGPSMPVSADRMKHLEFLQSVITRHANNSFLIKGWSLTVASAFFGFALSQRSWGLAVLALLPVAGFAWLDAYFLKQERLFRHLYNAAIVPNSHVSLFLMDTTGFQDESTVRWSSVMKSLPFRVFHGTIFVVAICLVIGLAIAPVIECIAYQLTQIIQHLPR